MEIDLDKILQTYVAESEECLVKMEEALVTLEANPDDDKLLEAIFRGAHTIKGNSASLGFPKIAGFAHVFEELLQRLRNHAVPVTGSCVTLLLKSVDALRQMIPEALNGNDELQPLHVELLHQLASGHPGVATQESPTDSRRRSHGPGRRREDVQAWLGKIGTVRIETQRLDRMLNLAGEITIAQGRLRQALESRSLDCLEALESQEQLERLTLDLQEHIMKLRMVSVRPTFRQFLRTVRDVAQEHGKLARLALEGEDVEVDVSVIEHLKDPLMHMIRNSIDHGIENPETRQALGKEACGLLTLRAYHEGSDIVIQVIDDGAGLNRERIIERALAMRTITEPEKLADQDLFRLIFEPGFSTAEAVTELSGRGVGMDVVKRNIEALRGSIALESQPGIGTRITIRLPLTLAIIEGFGVGVGQETYVLPLHAVVECLEMPPQERSDDSGQGIINLRGEPLPYVRLRNWFKLPNATPPRENIVVVEVDRVRAGLAVDALFGARQTVIKPLGKQFHGIPGLAGSAILGNGRVALILDIPGLLREVIRFREQDPTFEKPPSARSRTMADRSLAQLGASGERSCLN
jgi:two-component system chemotaxis sensor kinase CheA